MNIENLVTMANQIGMFYETMPDRTKALTDIAEHLKKYWDPRMRRELLAYIEEPGQHALQLIPVVSESLRVHRAML